MEKNNQNQINIELTEEIAMGVYANLAIITHSPGEFITDYVRLLPNTQNAKVVSRVVMSPQHAKQLLLALQDNVRLYEQQYGKILESNGGGPAPFPMNFTPPGKA